MTVFVELQHLSGSLAGQSQRVALTEGQTLRLGRSPQNDVKFSDTVDDNVSGTHAELRYSEGRLYIEDQRSTNGTFLNNSPCPPFQPIAVPDGSRIRLGKQGPEIQVTLEQKSESIRPEPPAPPQQKEAVGRQTLLREIDRARDEERDHVHQEVHRSQKKSRTWLVVGAAILALLIGGAAFLVYDLSMENSNQAIASTAQEIQNTWSTVEGHVSPAVAHLRCRYLLRLPQADGVEDQRLIQVRGGEVVGSAVLIRPDVLLTARHVVEPWRSAFVQSWDEIAETHGLTTEYEILEVQFPGQQPISATVLAVAENRDLALLSIADRVVEPVSLAASNSAVRVTDEVAIIGYPRELGESTLFQPDYSTTGAQRRTVEIRDMQPTFLRGTITLPVAETGDRAGLFFLDASVEPGSSGGAVVNRAGELLGVISQRLERAEEVELFGQTLTLRREVPGAVQAVNPDDIRSFLTRVGLL